MSLNLHAIVRQSINANYADETFKLYRSVGQKNVGGIVQAYYAPAEEIQGNFQSEGDSALDHANLAGQNTIIRRLYLFASSDQKQRPWAIYRPLARSGDYVEDSKGGQWLITAVIEDFSDAGWEAVRCTLQTTPQKLNIAEDEDESTKPDPEHPDSNPGVS